MRNPEQTPPSPLGRRSLLALLGVAAAAGGAWLAWRQNGTVVPTPTELNDHGVSAAAPDGHTTLPADFWEQTFDTPSGASVALASFKGHPLLLNFWATWCPPCVKEMPDLNRFHHDYSAKGWTVLGLAVDTAEPVKAYLSKIAVAFPIGLAGASGTMLAQALGNTTGGLPFSVLIGSDGLIKQHKTGATRYDELAVWAESSS